MAPLAIAHVVKAVWDATPDLDWFSYTFDEGIISIISASALLRQVSAAGKRIKRGGIPTKRPEYHVDFASREIWKGYARKAWKRVMDTGKDLTNLPMLDEQDALIAEEENAVATEPAAPTVCFVLNHSCLDSNADGNCELEGAGGLDTVHCVEGKRKLRERQEKCRAKRRKVPTSAAETFKLTS